jgi:hypothetical protein
LPGLCINDWWNCNVDRIASPLAVLPSAHIGLEGFWPLLRSWLCPHRGILTILAVYAASLAIWDSLDSLLLDWAPFARDNATYHLISVLDIRLEPCAP